MKKSAIITILGIGGLIGGVFVAYIYLSGLSEGGNILLLLLSIILLGVGAYLLFRAANFVNKPVFDESLVPKSPGLENSLEKNNKIIATWNKTNEARDRLKLLEVSASAQEKK